jgi:O-antigen ligase
VHATAIALDPNPDAFQWLKYPLFNANIRESGMLAASAVLIFNSYGLMASERRMQLLLFIAAMLSWAYLFWTGGRMGIIVTLFTFAVILGFTHYKKLSDRYGLLLSLAAIALGFLLCVQLSIFEWNGLGHFIGSQQSDNFSSGRSMIWGWAFNAIGQHPWLGNGPFSFYFLPERAASHFIYDHPHNALLQFGLEWGLIGAALFIALLLGLFYRGTKNLIAKPATPPLLCALAIILMLSLHSLTSATYWSIQPVCLLLAAYGCIIRSQLSLVSEKPDKAT